jgi:endonuclease III
VPLAAKDRPIEERASEIFDLLEEAYPDAKVALRFTNPLECLVATILSAQSTDKKINEVTETLFRKYRRPEDYLRVPEDELRAELKPTGFFNQKTKAVRAACQMLVDEFGGEVPRSMAELVRLPGVARKTANIVLWNCYPEDAERDPDAGIAVDTHVKRIAQRLGYSAHADPDKIERDLMERVPRDRWYRLSYLFIEHGRAVCRAPTPRCEQCPVEHLCPSSLV